LSYYRDVINNIINAHPDSSVTVLGDVNLDGIVSGDGTGAAATDDVTAFIQGWGTHQTTGNLISWQKGDLNQDGIVDVSDFLLLRAAFNGAGAGASANALTAFVDSAVPEPTSVVLAAIGAAFLALFCRRFRTALTR
jgi:trimeric autotransporter adhesin